MTCLLMPTEPTGPAVTVNVPGLIVGRFWVTPEVAWQAEDLEGGFSDV
jgi:hypothetical protein